MGPFSEEPIGFGMRFMEKVVGEDGGALLIGLRRSIVSFINNLVSAAHGESVSHFFEACRLPLGQLRGLPNVYI